MPVETDSPPGDEPMTLPPSVSINRLSDKFKEALGRADKPAAKAPEPVPEKVADVTTGTASQREAPKTENHKEPKIPREHFKVLETQRDEFKTKWEQAEERAKANEAKAKEYEAKAKDVEQKIPTDYEEIKSKVSEAEEIRKKFYVETDPIFKQAFDNKIAAGIDEIKDLAGSDKAGDILELISLPSSAKRDASIMELIEDLPTFKQHAISQVMRDVRKLQKERAAELAKPSENYRHLEEVKSQRSTKEKLERLEALERAVKITASEAARDTVHFQKLDGNESHNQRVIENEKMLREFTTHDMGPEDRAKLSMWAVRGIRSSQTDALKDALISKLQGELKAISDSNPSVSGTGKAHSGEKPLSASEKYQKAMKEGIPE